MTTFYSGYTNVANATTPAAPPTAPTLLIATAVSAHQIDLTWTAGTGQDGYIVERSLDGATGWTAVGSSATTAFSDKGLLSGTTYYYRVYGYNGSGISGYSNVANATTFLVIPVIRNSRALGSGGIGFRSEGLAYLFQCFSQNLTTDLQVDAYSTAYANGNAIPVTVVNGTLTPLKGDRAVRDTTNYPVLHASDIEVNAYTYHTNPANPPITGEPGTLTVDTTNQIGPPHTHAITTSANPGAASAILKSDVNGKLTLVGLTLSDNAPTLLLSDTGGEVYQIVNSSSVVEHSVVGGGTFISYDDATGNLTMSARSALGGVFFKTGGANHLWAVNAGDVYVDKIFYAKQAAAAGIALDHNSATGNYTLSLSPANLTGNRRHTFPNYNVVWPATDSAGHLASDGAGNLSWTAAGTGADPTASVGLTAVNGVATTFMRSDAAPPIDQGIIPTWTGVHTFSNTTDSGSSSTGAIVTSGGIGVAKSVFIDGSLYIGATAGSAGMYINKIFADSGGVVYGEWISMFAHSLSASSAAYYGGMHEAYVRSGNISNYTGSIVGMSSIVKHEGSGTVSLAVSALIAGTTNTGGGTITTNVGLDVQAQTAGATNYAIRTSTGQVSIGDTTDSTSTATGAVVIAGGVGITKNVYVGGTLLNIGSDAGASASVLINSAAATYRSINFQTAGVNRWLFRTNATAEGGSDAGSDFELVARHDDGTLIGNALIFTRATMDAKFGGHVGVAGTAPASNVDLYDNRAVTDTAGSLYAVYSRLDSNPAGASSASIFGYAGIATVASGNAQTHTGTLYGVLGQATHQGSGTLTAEIGIRSVTNSTGGGTVVSAFGVQALGPTITGAGSAITTIYGVYIGTQKVTGVTTGYGIYQNGASDLNSFAGASTFSNTTDSSSTTTGAVIVSGGVGIAKKLVVGGGAAFTGNMGFFGTASTTQQAIGAAAPAGGTGATAGAYDTAAHRDSLITLVNNMRTALINLGLCTT